MKKILKRVILAVIALIILAVITFFIWTQFIYTADEVALKGFFDQNSSMLTITEHPNYWEISPICDDIHCPTSGFIFYPGAKIDPQAYFHKLDFLANGNSFTKTFFITKPPLHLAFFGINQADEIIQNNPKITNWMLGGHSLGGAMSCEYAKSHAEKIKTLVLFGSYCGSDLSDVDLKTISIHGSLDGILTPEKVAENAKNLPPNNRDYIIDGMNHAQVGNYGDQSGDNHATKSDDQVKAEIMVRLENEL